MSLPENWQPEYDEKHTRYLVDKYKGQAQFLSEEDLKKLQNHAEAYNVPFYTGDFSLFDAIAQAGAGFVEGFTTLNIAEHPDNEYEQIARNIGHLVGFAPGIIGGPASLLPKTWVGARNLAASAARLKSVPMFGADVATKYAKQAVKSAGKGFVGRTQATRTARNFLLKDQAKHIVEGAFHLGTASGISAWQGGIDAMVEASMGGAIAGGVFRTIGNLTPGTGAHERIGKGLAGSLFMGLPSTMRGDTTPEQVYEYLMGAYFGGNEISWSRASSRKFVNKDMRKWARNAETKEDAIASGMDPEFHPKFDKLPEPVKPLVKEEALKVFGDPQSNRENWMPFALAEKLGLKEELTEAQLLEEGAKPTGEYRDGEARYVFSEKVIAEKFANVMTSGGTTGDNVFAKEANKRGIPAVHYVVGAKGRKNKATGFKRVLGGEELQLAEAELQRAEIALKRPSELKGSQADKERIRNLQLSNWYKVKWADSVYVVGNLTKNKRQVFGAPGIAAQMAINNGKKVYVFSQPDGRWFTWSPRGRFGGEFIEAGKPPKPTRRFAGITDYKNITQKGRQAIKSLFSTHYPEVTTVTEKVAEAQISKKKRDKLDKLSDELDTLQESYDELRSEIVLKKGREDVSDLEAQLLRISETQKDAISRFNRLSNIDLAAKEIPTEVKKKEGTSSELSEKQDTDFEGPVELEVGKTSLQFSLKHLKDFWAGAESPLMAQNMKRELSQLIESTLTETVGGIPITQGGEYKFLRKNSKENLSEQWANEVEAKIKKDYDKTFEFSQEARSDMRKWMTRENNGHIVRHLQSDGKVVRPMVNPDAPVTLAGNRKIQKEPRKPIEEAFIEAGGVESKNEPALYTLDTVTIEGTNGRRDITISEYRTKHSKKYQKMMEKAIKDMSERGYYPLGGKGDNDRIIWVKYHPHVAKATTSQLKTLLANANLGKELTSSFKDFKKQFKGTINDFRKMVTSNILYDLQMNGMESNPTNPKTIANIETLLTHSGFIKNSSAFNKRQQIWMNNAWAGDSVFIKNQGIELNSKGNYNYIISHDLSKAIRELPKKEYDRIQKLVSTKNSDIAENVDGAILVRDDVLTAINKDFGNPEVGQNKSFIVSPHKERGALLGKYMMHSAGPTLSKLMAAHPNKLHMIMQDTAVKQRGLRKRTDYYIDKGRLELLDNAKVYGDLNPEHVRGNYGVYGNNHFIENQRVPKQLLQMLLSSAKTSVPQDVIDNVFEGLIGERFRGEQRANNLLSEYLDYAKRGDLSAKDLNAKEVELVKNIEKIGIRELVDAMKEDYAPGLSEKIYSEILRLNKNEAMDSLISKESKENDYDLYSQTIEEFTSITDRVLSNAKEWAREQEAKGIKPDITSAFMHKFTRDYRVKAVQNFIVQQATRPKVGNSSVGFMRPYDKSMRINLDKINPRLRELETNDEIFFLDKAFENLWVTLDMPGNSKLKGMKLGELWRRYENPRAGEEFTKEQKEYVEEVFEAVTVRVPMDSMSGAQVLKFSGFTGREGHGILMHGRAMRAEGGADLDGDKSFVFFGGKNGFSKSWKEVYKNNKKEFYIYEHKKTKKTIDDNLFQKLSDKEKQSYEAMVTDNKEAINPKTKKTYREELVKSLTPEQKNLYNSKAYQYSPMERLRISFAAVDGRNQLGPAVVSKQVMSAAYSGINAEGGTDSFIVRLKTGKKNKKGKPIYGDFRVEFKTKTGHTSEEIQRSLGRAQIGLASDPLDELGLKGSSDWYRQLWNAHFEVTDVRQRKGRFGKFDIKVDKDFIKKNIDIDKIKLNTLKGGTYGNLLAINQAYWGKNFAEGRKFSMEEILDMGHSVSLLGNKAKNASILGKTGELLKNLDWSDSIFAKIDLDSVNNLISNHNDTIAKYDILKNFMQRSSFKVVPSKVVTNIMSDKNRKFELWTANGVVRTAEFYKDFLQAIKGTKYEKRVLSNPSKFFAIGINKKRHDGDFTHYANRRDMLIEMVKEAEDFIVNDMTDITTASEIAKIIDRMINNRDKGIIQPSNEKQLNFSEVIQRIHQKTESLKRNSYLMSRDRRKLKSYDDLVDAIDIKNNPGRQLAQTLKEMQGETQRIREIEKEPTAELDQMQIDNEIFSFKRQLTEEGKKLFDHMLLGSLNRGNLNKIEELENSITDWSDPLIVDVVKGLRKEASRTSISRLGFGSNMVSDVNIKEHIGSLMTNFSKVEPRMTKEEISETVDNAVKYKSRIEDFDQGLIEKFLPSGYQGLKEGPLDKESKQLVAEISDLMSGWTQMQKKQLPYFTRGLLEKDLNAMNKQDFRVLRNWLVSVQNGTWMQRLFQPKGPTELGKRHHMLFPQTINRELMRDDLVLMHEQGFFHDGFGRPRTGKIVRPTHYVDIVQNGISLLNDASIKMSDTYIKRFNESQLFYTGLEEANAFWEIAIRQRESSKEAERVIRSRHKKEPFRADKLVDRLRAKRGASEREYGWEDKGGKVGLKNKEFTIEIDGKRQNVTGKQIVDRINSELTRTMRDMLKFIRGEEGALDMYKKIKYDRNRNPVEFYNYEGFLRDLQSHFSGKTPKAWKKDNISDVPSYFGVDGLRKMAREMQLDWLNNAKVPKEYIDSIRNQPASETNTGDLGDSYFPHMFFEKTVSKNLMKTGLEKIMNTPESTMTKKEKLEEIRKLYYKNKSLGGEMRFQEMEEWEMFQEVIEDVANRKKISEQKIRWFSADVRAGSMKNRELESDGYSIDPVVVESYIRSLTSTYSRQLSHMFGKWNIDKMGQQMYRKWGKEQTQAWQEFMRLYVQDALGNPAVIPERLYNDPKMKIKGTPYGWWADNKVRDRLNKIGDSLGITDKKLPKEVRGLDVETLRHWSNLEAQYQMASLLAHPKSMVANIFGGTMHTIQSTGVRNYLKARDYNYLSKINKEWTSKQAVDDFVVRQGVLPEYLVYEMGLQKAFQTTKGKSFLTELTSKLTRDPQMSEATIGEIASKYGLKDKAVNFAAKFMTGPERALRRDSFMAHYIHAWNKFGGAIKEYDHPYLIKMAKKGVKATQFLYNAPFRPAFARTALGKMMTRFQLWGWNSVRFRNDVYRQAKMYGFEPGTEEWRRFERTMQTDLFTFALANIFAYSLFESNLPQPWGWVQDYSDWIFGDEESRDKAFYGAWPKEVAPLQMVTPPGLRMVGPTFNAMLNDDWSKVAQYYTYTLFPFGRMFRDVNPYSKGNLIENPMRLPEKVFGFPMMQLQRNVTAWKDKEDEEGNIIEGDKPYKPAPF